MKTDAETGKSNFVLFALFALFAFALLIVGCTQPNNIATATPSPSPTTQQTIHPPNLGITIEPTPAPSPSPALTSSSTPLPNASATPNPEVLKLEDYDGGVFKIKKSVGWSVAVGGSCETFSFVIRDEAKPQRQIFYFSELGPVYLDESQKTIDKRYMDMGGHQIAWYDMPVVKPLTPENFLKSVPLMMELAPFKKFMTALPELRDAEIISSETAKSPVTGDTKLMRALFKAGSGASEGLGEGQFFLTVNEVIPLTGYASGGIGYGFTFVGISAEKKEFKNLEKTLTESVNSFNFSESYVAECMRQQQKTTEAVLNAGKTLSETSDIIMDEWDQRSQSDDIISEKRSDAILDRERVYDPDTGTVYDVANGFYDNYDANRNKFDMNNLQTLPANDWNLWTAAPEDASNIH